MFNLFLFVCYFLIITGIFKNQKFNSTAIWWLVNLRIMFYSKKFLSPDFALISFEIHIINTTPIVC